MIGAQFITSASDQELAKISGSIDAIIKAHYMKLQHPKFKKLSPMPTINPALLKLKSLLNAEMENRKYD